MQYTVFYDSHCPLCSREIELLRERHRLPAWLLKRPQCENGSCTLPPSQR